MSFDQTIIKDIVRLESLGSSSKKLNLSTTEAKVVWNLKFMFVYETEAVTFDQGEEEYLCMIPKGTKLPRLITTIDKVLGEQYLKNAYRWYNTFGMSFDSYQLHILFALYHRSQISHPVPSELLKITHRKLSINLFNCEIPMSEIICSLFFSFNSLGNKIVNDCDEMALYELLGLYLSSDFSFIDSYTICPELLKQWSQIYLNGSSFSLLEMALLFKDQESFNKLNLENDIDIYTTKARLLESYPEYSELLPLKTKVEFTPYSLSGWVKTEIGIGEDVRTAALSFSSSGIPFSITDVAAYIPPSPKQVDLGFGKFISSSNCEEVEILFLDAATQFRYQVKRKTTGNFNDSIKIAVCPWELPQWPEEAKFVFRDINYFWAATNFIKNAFKDIFPNEKIFHAPPAVHIDEIHLEEFDVRLIEGEFVFLTVFDGLSSISRKNPIASIRAFQRAFVRGENVKLVVKTMNFNNNSDELNELAQLIRSDGRIELVNEKLTKSDLFKLVKSCHSFISLHRSEGFGRNIAEAMLFKRPVIVSAFSGNLDFCFAENSYLVEGELVPVKKGEYWYSDGQKWFDASVEHAAQQMYEVFINREVAFEKAERAYKYMSTYHSIQSTGERYSQLLSQIANNLL